MSIINITATTNETTVSASATAITVSAADSSTTLSPTTVLAAYNAGTGLTLSGTTFSVDAAQTQITSVGTLTSLTSGTITSNATKLDLTDTTTNSTSVYGPTIELYRDGGDGDGSSTTVGGSDKLGTIDFYGNNDAGTPEKIKYAKIFGTIYEETDGAESGRLSFSVINAGTHTEGTGGSSILDLEPDVAQFNQNVRIQAKVNDSGVQATPTPILELYQLDGPEADDGDHLGEIQFTAYNANGYSPAKHKYAGIHAEIIDETNATEDGSLHFTAVTAGTEDTTVLTLNGNGSTLFSDLIAPLTIKSTTTSADLVITNTLDSADASPIIKLQRDAGADGHADGDDVGKLEFYGTNDRGLSSGGPEDVLYGSMFTEVVDSSDGTEDGQIKFTSIKAGSATDVLTLNGNGSTLFSDLIAPLTIRSTTTSADLVITNSEASSADASPIIELFRSHGYDGNSDGDDIGKIEFYGSNDRGLSSGGPEKTLFGSFSVEVVDASDGTEDGHLRYSRIVNGTQETGRLVLQPDNGGIQFPNLNTAPTNPQNGHVYYDVPAHKLKIYENGNWVNV